MIAAKKQAEAQAPNEYAVRLERIEDQLSLLVEALTTPIDPPQLKAKGRKTQAKSNKARCLRARIGRVAKRHGMTSEEWIGKYGLVDMLPEPPKKAKKAKKKA
ncbi:unnamed protein product, partial [marine sediment metagenome]